MYSRIVLSRLNVGQHAGQKAPLDVREIARIAGFSEIDLPPYNSQSKWTRIRAFARAALRMMAAASDVHKADVVLVQYPLGRINGSIVASAARRNASIVLIHDLESLRWPQFGKREIRQLRHASVLISHTPNMTTYLRQQLPSATILELGCFDYLVDGSPPPLAAAALRPDSLLLAGNLSPAKAAYLYRTPDLAVPIKAYGAGCDLEHLPACVKYEGMLDMNRPIINARDSLGLIWDGTSPDNLSGATGEYLLYNAPHKFSMYMALGLPVVVSPRSAMASFVLERGLGIVAGNIAEAAVAARRMPAEEWSRLIGAVEEFRLSVLGGDHTRDALSQALSMLVLDGRK